MQERAKKRTGLEEERPRAPVDGNSAATDDVKVKNRDKIRKRVQAKALLTNPNYYPHPVYKLRRETGESLRVAVYRHLIKTPEGYFDAVLPLRVLQDGVKKNPNWTLTAGYIDGGSEWKAFDRLIEGSESIDLVFTRSVRDFSLPLDAKEIIRHIEALHCPVFFVMDQSYTGDSNWQTLLMEVAL